MFSGLTNQVSSWMGAVKGEPHDEEVPSPAVSQTAESHQQQEEQAQQSHQQPEETPVADNGDGDKKHSPTKAGGVFSSVKSQMSGWLGSASIPSMPSMPSMPAMPAMPSIPSIPGLRKSHNAGDEGGVTNEGLAGSPSEQHATHPGDAAGGYEETGADDDDKSRYIRPDPPSATEGADSRPQSAPGTPTEDSAGQIGAVTNKVTQGVKSFGSFLYSSVNKAGAKIKKTVEDNQNILGEFNKEQEAFIKGQAQKTDSAVPPWIGNKNEEKIKEEILSLSADRRNFVRAPPVGVDFQFDYDISYPVALSIMAEDPALEKMRFELVPKIITEENFWRNYFYRVSLICQAGDLGTLGSDGSLVPQGSSEDNDVGKNKTNETIDTNKSDIETKKMKKLSESEFVSDTFQTTDKDLEEVSAGLRKLGIDSLVQQTVQKSEEQWEKDLEAELQDYEVVNDGNESNHNWEKDVDDLLGDDTDDLK